MGQSRRRQLLILLLTLAGGLAALALALVLSLRSATVRQELLRYVRDMVESSTGLVLTADELDLGLRAGSFGLTNVRVRASADAQRPFLEISRLEARIDKSALMRGEISLPMVRLNAPVLDLSAPLPASARDEAEPHAPTEIPVQINRFEVRNGAIRWEESPPGLEKWVGSGGIGRIHLGGALLGGRISAEIVSAVAEARSCEMLGATSAFLAGTVEADISRDPALQTLELRLSDGTMEAVPLWPDAAEWVGPVGVQGLEAALLVSGDVVRFHLKNGTAEVGETARIQPLSLNLSGLVTGSLSGPFNLEKVSAQADGLRLEARGEVGLDPSEPLAFQLEIDVEPEKLLVGALPGGKVSGSGRLDLRALEGSFDLTGERLPAELLAPWMDPELGELVEMAGTELDFKGEATLAGAWNRVSGTAQATWRQKDDPLVALGGALTPSDSGTTEQVISFTLSLLPESPGERKGKGEIRLPQWSRWTEASFHLARVEAHVPDLGTAAKELALRWPGILPELPHYLKLEGPLSIDATFTGQVLSPEVDLRALWMPPRGGAVRLDALGDPLELEGSSTVHVRQLAIEDVVEGFSGTVNGELRIRRTPDALSGELLADGRDLCLGQGLPLVQAIHAEASLEDGAVRLQDASLWWEERVVRGQGSLLLGDPIERAHLSLELYHPTPGISFAVVLASLDEGRLTVDAPWVDTTVGPARGEVSVPLAALDEEPRLKDLLAQLPLARASGPVELSAELGPLDGTAVARLLAPDATPVTVAGRVAMEAILDLHAPAAGKGELRMKGMRADLEDHRLEITEPLVARLSDSRLTLPLTRLEADGQPLDISGALELDGGWKLREAHRGNR